MRLLVCVFVLVLTMSPLHGQEEALHQLIDQQTIPIGGTSAVCSDTEFLRRVYLDLTGLPPHADDVRTFAANSSPDKRQQVVDELLESPQCDRHLTSTFDVMLMERRANQHVPQDTWHNWLFQQVRARRPWNEIVSDILSADGDDSKMRPAARFFLDRQAEPHLLTRDVGRIFFGRDMQCAQCHDHPLFDDFLQVDYHGLHAFLAPGYPVVRKVKKKDGDKEKTVDMTVYAERAGNDLTFESVFFQGTTRRTGPKLPDDMSVENEFVYPGDEYEVAPAEGIKSVPKVSRRTQLAELATSGSNRMFNENIANRLWAHMLGRGLVHPVDLHHFENPPTNPELLRLLGEQIAAMNFDVRRFLREIALSQAYQRPFDQTSDMFALATVATEMMNELEQQQTTLAEQADAAEAECDTAIDAWDEAQAALVPVAAELDGARKAYDTARTALQTAEEAVTKKDKELKAKQTALPAVIQAAEAAQQAAATLTEDSDLAAAVTLFNKRTTELEQAIASLTEEVGKLTAATEAPRADLDAKKQAVDGLLTTLPPLQETLRTTESALLEKRRRMQALKAATASGEQELETLRLITGLTSLRDSLIAAETVVQERISDQETTQKKLADQQLVVAQRQEAVTQMSQPLTEAESKLQSAHDAHAERAKPVNAIQAVIDAAASAKTSLPDDAVLADVSSSLNERLVPLQSELSQAQTQVDAATAELKELKTSHDQVVLQLNAAVADRDATQQSAQLADQAVTQAHADVQSARESVDAALRSITDRWASDFTVASLKPLTPEQMCWSLLKVTGVYDRYRKAEADKLAADQPLTEEQQNDAQLVADRDHLIEQKTYDVLKSNVNTFVRFYGAAAGQPQNDFFATADQALFAANAGTLNGWAAPSSGNVTERIVNAENSEVAAEELYLAVLNRHPSEEETAEVDRLLTEREQDKPAVATELVWGLMTSIEFRFNH